MSDEPGLIDDTVTALPEGLWLSHADLQRVISAALVARKPDAGAVYWPRDLYCWPNQAVHLGILESRPLPNDAPDPDFGGRTEYRRKVSLEEAKRLYAEAAIAEEAARKKQYADYLAALTVSPEPWATSEQHECESILAANGESVTTWFYSRSDEEHAPHPINMRRIVAAVNFCAAFDTEFLEKNTVRLEGYVLFSHDLPVGVIEVKHP